MKTKIRSISLALFAMSYLACTARVDIAWTNNVPSSWLDDSNWSTSYAPGGANDPTPNESYAYMSGAHVDVTLDGAISPISILGMYSEAKLTVKNTTLEINGDENITNIWGGSKLTLDNATLKPAAEISFDESDNVLLAQNGSKLITNLTSYNLAGSNTMHFKSGSTLDANGAGDVFFFNSVASTTSSVIFEGQDSGITNFADNSNRGLWISGGSVNITLKDTTFGGLIASAAAVGNGGFTFDNTVFNAQTNNPNFIYNDLTMNGAETYAINFKNATKVNGNDRGLTAGLKGDGGTWQLNLSGGSITESINVNIASASALAATNAKMQVNVTEGSVLGGRTFNGGTNVTGANSAFELNVSGAGSKVNFVDAQFGAGANINLKDADNDAIHTMSALYLGQSKVNIELANRNADVEEAIIFGWHIGAGTAPEFLIDFSKLTLDEGMYKFVVMGYMGDYHSDTKDFMFDYIFGENSGFYEAELQVTDKQWIVWASTSGYVVPEPSTYAAIFGVLALAFAIYRRKRQ